MSDDSNPRKSAVDAAEKVLTAIYGEDLEGCPITLEAVSAIIEDGMIAETKNYKMLNEALIGAIRQIQNVSTPPNKEEVETIEEVADVLGERADVIHQVTTKILEAWDKAKGQL
jgi:hypothetical protein